MVGVDVLRSGASGYPVQLSVQPAGVRPRCLGHCFQVLGGQAEPVSQVRLVLMTYVPIFSVSDPGLPGSRF